MEIQNWKNVHKQSKKSIKNSYYGADTLRLLLLIASSYSELDRKPFLYSFSNSGSGVWGSGVNWQSVGLVRIVDSEVGRELFLLKVTRLYFRTFNPIV